MSSIQNNNYIPSGSQLGAGAGAPSQSPQEGKVESKQAKITFSQSEKAELDKTIRKLFENFSKRCAKLLSHDDLEMIAINYMELNIDRVCQGALEDIYICAKNAVNELVEAIMDHDEKRTTIWSEVYMHLQLMARAIFQKVLPKDKRGVAETIVKFANLALKVPGNGIEELPIEHPLRWFQRVDLSDADAVIAGIKLFPEGDLKKLKIT